MAEFFNNKSREIRSYEITIWTLQDRFVSVLKQFNMDCKGQIQDPEVVIGNGEIGKLTFSIPKMYWLQGQKYENPLWHQLDNYPLEANMHKLKVVYNKTTPEEGVQEFLVTSVTLEHSGDAAIYKIDAEDLAFHELGKIGYKISLSPEIYLEEVNEWFINGEVGEQPINNIQYWNDKVFGTNINEKVNSLYAGVDSSTFEYIKATFKVLGIDIYQEDFIQENDLYYLPQQITMSKINIDKYYKTNWVYEVQMDWSSYSQALSRDSHKVYEEEYTSSWDIENNTLVPRKNDAFREKMRNVEIEESNIYNITQTIAEAFGVFCRYEYVYDDRYQIIGRKVIYYNNYFIDAYGHLDLTYPYSASSISRTIDSMDLVTKMYVRMPNSNANGTNILSIMSVEANRSKEDYILDFDYLKSINNLTQEQYDAITPFEVKMRQYNITLENLEARINALQNELTDLEAEQTIIENAITLDRDRYNDAEEHLKDLTGGADVITVDGMNAKMCILTQVSGETGRSINMPFEGVDFASVKLYKKLNYIEKAPSDLIDPGQPVYDDYGNLARIKNIMVEETQNSIYITCNYSPSTCYSKIATMWAKTLYQDLQRRDKVIEKIENINLQLYGSEHPVGLEEAIVGIAKADQSIVGGISANSLIAIQEETLNNKRKDITAFERMMGPALREGNWQPEDYNDYGDYYHETLPFGAKGETAGGLSFVWDTELFENEEPVIYSSNINNDMQQHIIVDLSDALDSIAGHLDDLSLVYYDKDTVEVLEAIEESAQYREEWLKKIQTETCMRSFQLGSGCELGYVYDTTHPTSTGKPKLIPVLIITDDMTLTDDQIDFITSNGGETGYTPFLGSFTPTVDENGARMEYSVYHSGKLNFLTVNGQSIRTIIDSDHNTPETYQIQRVVPRIFVNSLKLKVDDSLKLNVNATVAENPMHDSFAMYEDFSVLVDERRNGNEVTTGYYITPKLEKIFQYGATDDKTFSVQYVLSNADVSIYLDALEIMRENAYPKVTYDVELALLNPAFSHIAYRMLNRIVHINDYELKFEDVHGYISKITLKLDKCWEDSLEIKNYETKFEDIFTTMVVQTESMKKNEGLLNTGLRAFAPNGEIKADTLQASLLKADLNYSFNQGSLTIDQENGIWATSDDGVVAIRGGGIFTAYQKDANENWIWNTGILPSGINADLITTGQLDTNKIKVYAGDQLRFQLNGDGLFAYKSLSSDYKYLFDEEGNSFPNSSLAINLNAKGTDTIDFNQYVQYNEDGLFLIARDGAQVVDRTDKSNPSYITIGKESNGKIIHEVIRAELSWDGLILRNWNGDDVFYADPDTGDLTLRGQVIAHTGEIGGWTIGSNLLQSNNINIVSNAGNNLVSGIFLTKAENALQSISYNNETYYAYTSEGQTYYINAFNASEFTYSDELDYTVLQYQPTLISVSPRYVKTITATIPENTEGTEHTGTGRLLQRADGTYYYENANYTDGGSTNITTITEIYVMENASAGTPITDKHGDSLVYDYGTSVNSSWYVNLPDEFKNADVIIEHHEDQLTPVTLANNTVLTPVSFTPTFSIVAETGKVSMNNGTIGSFSFDEEKIQGGTLSNTKLDNDNYFYVGSTRHNLSDYARCFTDITANSAAGTFTLTRLDGTTANFNIAAMAAYQNAMAAAGSLPSQNETSKWSSTHNNSTCSFTVTSGYGTKRSYTVNISDVFRNGAASIATGISMTCSSWTRSGNSYSAVVTAHSGSVSRPYPVTCDASTVYTSGYNAGYSDGYANGKKAGSGTGGCFAAGTLVTLANGTYMPIEKLHLDDTVLAYNEQTHQFVPGEITVIQKIIDRKQEIVDLYLSSGKIITVTVSHPFLTTEGWCAIDPIRALEEYEIETTPLHENHILISNLQDNIVIEKIIPRPDLADEPVYHLQVAPVHTFMVEDVVVHNVSPTSTSSLK